MENKTNIHSRRAPQPTVLLSPSVHSFKQPNNNSQASVCAYECENIICNKNKNNLDWFPTLAKPESVSRQSALPNPSGSKRNPSFSLSLPSWLPSTDTHTRTHKAGEFLFCVVNPQSVFDYHRRLCCNSWLGNSFSKGKGG